MALIDEECDPAQNHDIKTESGIRLRSVSFQLLNYDTPWMMENNRIVV
jgi:hypothetical protein